MNRLTKEDEVRATEALKKCAEQTKNITDTATLNKVAYDILFKELGDKPELLKRACEGYNSAKSLYKFGVTDDNTRGDTFSILDAPGLAERARRELSSSFVKRASAINGFNKAQFLTTPTESTMKKAASAENTPKRERKEPAIPMRKMSSVETVTEINKFSEDLAKCLHKVARDRDEAILAVEDAEERFISAMATETPAMRKEAAEMLSNAYGDLGQMLVKLFNVSRGHQKVANYNPNRFKGSVRLPDTVLFKSAAAVLEAHMWKYAADLMQRSFVERSVDYVKDVFNARTAIRKEAALGSLDMLASAIGANKITEKMLPEDRGKGEAELEREINTTELQNILKQHSVKRAFMNTVTDSTVSRYPLHQVTKAFNEALAELPMHMRDLPPTAFSALLKSRTIARLGRGGAASGSDVDQIQQIQQAFGRVRPSDITSYGREF